MIHTIQTELSRHPFDYGILLLGGIISIGTVLFLRGERMEQFSILFIFVLFYIAWGFHHHHHLETLQLRTVLEYVFIGFVLLFGVVLLFII